MNEHQSNEILAQLSGLNTDLATMHREVAKKNAELIGMCIGLQQEISAKDVAKSTLEKQQKKLTQQVEEQISRLTKSNRRLQREMLERRKAERSLRRSENHLRLISSQLPVVLWTTDRQLRFTYSQGAGLSRQGLEAGQLIGMTLYEYFHTNDENFEPIAAHRRAIDEQHVTFEITWRDHTFHASVEPLRDDQGSVIGTVGIAIDITAQKRIEAQLAEAQRIAGIGVWEWNLQSNEVSWSDETYYLFGVEKGKFRPCCDSFINLVVPEDRQRVEASVKATLRCGEPLVGMFRIRHADGFFRDFSGQGRLTHDAGGRPLRFLGTVQDVTERQALLRQLRCREQLALLGTLTTAIAHEINSPLAAARIAVATAADVQGEQDVLNECFAVVASALDRCQRTVENTLRFARRQSVEKSPSDLNEIVRNAVEITRYYANYHGSKVDMRLEDELPWVTVSASGIEQVVVNLIRNAVQAGEGTMISVSTAREVQHICIQVQDNGRGIPETARKSIFEPFVSGRSSDDATGLGLAISGRIIEDHQGRIEVESKVGHGTTFSIMIPLMPEEPTARRPHFFARSVTEQAN